MSPIVRINLLLGLLATAACQDGVHDRTEIASGGAIMRLADPIPEGSMPRTASSHPQASDTGSDEVPIVDMAILKRGETIYRTHCAACHGYTGGGNGIVARHGFPAPPSFHEPPQRDITRRRIFEVITLGVGDMASFAERISPEDRWAAAAYVKTLQLALGAPEPQSPEDRGE